MLSFEAKCAPDMSYCSRTPMGGTCLSSATELISEQQGLSLSQTHLWVRKSHPHPRRSKKAQKDKQGSRNLQWSQNCCQKAWTHSCASRAAHVWRTSGWYLCHCESQLEAEKLPTAAVQSMWVLMEGIVANNRAVCLHYVTVCPKN